VVRHKLGVAASALVLLAVAGGVGATIREARIADAHQRRSEQRFNDVRKLANSLMYEIHDSVEGLPGATPTRKLIVQRSLEYLDGLSHEAAGDISLQRELADAYERIGLVQGDPNGTNLGDIAGARDSFTKALSIREKLSTTGAQSADMLALAASYREMCAFEARYLANIGSALRDCGEAVIRAEELYKAQPTNPSVQAELARAYDATGTVYGQGSTSGNAGDFYAALENHRKGLDLVTALAAAHPQDLDLSNWQGKVSLSTADDLFEIGQVSKAVPLYAQATSTFESLIRQSNKIRYADSLDLAYQRMGDMLLVAGHFDQALVYYRKTMDVCTELVAADPKSMAYRTSLVASRATYGNALWRAGHVTEGIAFFNRGLAELAASRQQDARAEGLETTIRLWMADALEKQHDAGAALHNYSLVRDYYAGICQSDPKDMEDCLSLAGTLDRIGSIHIQQSLLDAALAEYNKALEISEPPSVGARPNLEALYTVVNVYFGLGKLYASMSRGTTASRKKIELAEQSCNWFQKSYAAYRRIPEWIPITPNEFDSRDGKEIEKQLASCHLPRAGTIDQVTR
jgi:non-specific serine/threonine protein kinase/serine/threonine-protein kinase